MDNIEIAELLKEVAAAYQARGKAKYKFKIIAYQRAADAVEHLSSEAKDLWDEGKLEDVPGVGESIAAHLGEIFRSGESKHFKTVKKSLPEAMFELIKIPGVGPKTALSLARELEIGRKEPVKELLKRAKEGRVAKIEGFGEDSEKEIIRNIEDLLKKPKKRLLLPRALRIADEIIQWLKEDMAVEEADALGSVRRRASTVGDIDIAVASRSAKKVIERFIGYPKLSRIVEKGERTASIMVPGGIRVDLMVQEPKSYGSLLQHFTGSKHHNIALREYAIKREMSLSEYGIREIRNSKSEIRKIKDEKDFYKALGLAWIAPELREDTGEIEASLRSAQGKADGLPKLVELKDIKGDLQMHSSFDVETSHDLGENTMEEMIEKANELGYEYIAFTEHNPSMGGHSQNEVVEILKRKREKIDKLNYSLNRVKERESGNVRRVFNSLEIDILANGELAVSEQALETLDFALVSIHSSFQLPKSEMTARVMRAMGHTKVKIFAHPTARKINYREGVEIDWERLFEFCIKNDKWLEINADPMRLDLPDFLVREGVKHGVKFTLGTDAHNSPSMENMAWGVYTARRGWAEKNDIVNCMTFEKFEKLIG